jgi:hypothetical protein
MTPRINGDLLSALDAAYTAWADCAARVDLIVDCQRDTALKGDAA